MGNGYHVLHIVLHNVSHCQLLTMHEKIICIGCLVRQEPMTRVDKGRPELDIKQSHTHPNIWNSICQISCWWWWWRQVDLGPEMESPNTCYRFWYICCPDSITKKVCQGQVNTCDYWTKVNLRLLDMAQTLETFYFGSKDANDKNSKKETGNASKTNKCNQCDYASSHTVNLRAHLKMHSGERLNKCNQYEKTFESTQCTIG